MKWLVAIAEYVQHSLSVLYSFAQASLAKQSNSLTYCLPSEGSQPPPIPVMKIAMLFSSKMFVERYIVQRTFKNLFGVYSCFKADKVSIDMMTNLSLLK